MMDLGATMVMTVGNTKKMDLEPMAVEGMARTTGKRLPPLLMVRRQRWRTLPLIGLGMDLELDQLDRSPSRQRKKPITSEITETATMLRKHRRTSTSCAQP